MFNILSVYLWVPIISPLSAILAMMIRIPSHVISVAPKLILLAWRITSRRAPDGPGDGQFGLWGSLPCPVLQHPSFLIHFFSGFTCFQASQNQSSLLLFLNLSSASSYSQPQRLPSFHKALQTILVPFAKSCQDTLRFKILSKWIIPRIKILRERPNYL